MVWYFLWAIWTALVMAVAWLIGGVQGMRITYRSAVRRGFFEHEGKLYECREMHNDQL